MLRREKEENNSTNNRKGYPKRVAFLLYSCSNMERTKYPTPTFANDFLRKGVNLKRRKACLKNHLTKCFISMKSKDFLGKGHTLSKIFVYIPQGKPSSRGKYRIEPLKVPPEVLDKIISIDREKHLKSLRRKLWYTLPFCLQKSNLSLLDK